MKNICLLLLACMLFGTFQAAGQKITYSDPDRDDPRSLSFEIIGKLGGRVLVYKNYHDLHYISVFDAEMHMVEKNRLDIANLRVQSTEFLVYPDFAYMIFQYQKRGAIYCSAIKLDASGKGIGPIIEMDSTENVNTAANSKIYTVIFSENKQKIMIFKINSKNERQHILTTSLFNSDLQLLKKSRLSINMPQRNDFLSEFTLDNDGDMVCVQASGTSSNDNINKVSLLTKPALLDTYAINELKLNGIFLDDIRIKADNINKHYLITSFVSKVRRGNIEGLYYTLWDKIQNRILLDSVTSFSEELRNDAKGEGGAKAAFNDFFLKNIILRKDGGFIIIAESAYTSTRGSTMNRWDYLYGSPYWSPTDYYTSRNSVGNYPWGYYNNPNNSVQTRYFADNIAAISFEPNGKLEWSNVIRKSQFDDNTDNFIGYGLLNSGDQLHFMFNIQEKRTQMLSDQSIAPNGQIDRSPTFKNMDKGYDFMPRHAKQIGQRLAIVPCQYRGFTCFAKIEF